jgi:putative chitinase
MEITQAILIAGTGATPTTAATWLPPIQAAAQKYCINTANRISSWLANVGVESGGLRDLIENLSYSGPVLWADFHSHFASAAEANSFSHQPEKIANRVYSNRLGNGNEASGDGWMFRGRGLLQVTGRANYQHQQIMLGLPLVEHPEQLEQPGPAALSAGQFFADNCLWQMADAANFQAIAGVVNTGNRMASPDHINGYPARLKLWVDCLKACG